MNARFLNLRRSPLALPCPSSSTIASSLATAIAAGLLILAWPQAALAQSSKADTAKPAATASAAGTQANRAKAGQATRNTKGQTAARRTAPAAAAVSVAAADPAQLAAAREVMLGASACEFGQRIHVESSRQHPGYLDLSFKNRQYLMKPVLSPTGALRLEDVKSEALLIQIGSKTMLMDQKTGRRLVDNCIHPQHQAVATTQGSSLGVAGSK